MKPSDMAREELHNQYPELWQFFGSHLHQDWVDDYDSWERAIDDAVFNTSHGDIQLVLEQLEQVLALELPAADLAAVLLRLGCNYWPGRNEDYESWLGAVAKRVRETSSTNAI